MELQRSQEGDREEEEHKTVLDSQHQIQSRVREESYLAIFLSKCMNSFFQQLI